MLLPVRAIYQDGNLRLLEPVDLQNGQQVEILIQVDPPDDIIRAALGDLVRWPDPTDNRDAEVEAEADNIARAFSIGRPLSEIIIEDRGEKFF